MLDRWFENYGTFQIPIDLYLGTKADRDLYIENKFTMLVQALEALHRRLSGDETRMPQEIYYALDRALRGAVPNYREWLNGVLAFGNEPTLRQRLKSLLKGMETIFSVDVDVKAIVNDMVNARNDLAHYSNKTLRAPVSTGRLYELSVAAEMLLHAHFLALMGLSREEAADAYTKSQVWSYNARRLRPLRASSLATKPKP